MKKIVHCQECSKETTNPKFCSSSCAATFHNKNRIEKCPNKDKTKTIKCKGCGNNFEINIRADENKSTCLKCKENKRVKICVICGSLKCPNREVCRRKNAIRGILTKYFGYDISKLGSFEAIKEFYRVRDKIIDLYSTNSLAQICHIIEYPAGPSNLWNCLKFLNLKFRSFSDANKKSMIDYGISKNIYSTYKSGWHKTWEGKDIFYRSSYELEYAQELDEEKISYDVECLRIEYWDSQELKYRIAIPDFYLPETNTIVEIKSTYFYDPINMKDKFIKYKELGYNFKLFIDKNPIAI